MSTPLGSTANGPSAMPGRDLVVPAPPGLPFAQLNLRHNPFGELPLDRRADVAVVEIGPFVERLRRPGYAVQFMGDKGRGKTTHLLAILRHFPRAAYLHVGEGQRPPIPRSHPLFLDEIQRVSRWRRRRVFRRPGISLAIGTHEDVADELRRAGFTVETFWPAQRLDAARLHAILNRRIVRARRGPGPIPTILRTTAQSALDRHGDDVRAIEHYFYDLFQDLTRIRNV